MSNANEVGTPRQGEIRALAITGTASAEQDLGEDAQTRHSYMRFISDVKFWITFHDVAGGTTDPDETAVTGDGRTWMVPASQAENFRADRLGRYFKVKGSAVGTLRWYPG